MLEFPIKLHVMLLSWHEAFFKTLFEALFLIIQKYIINQYVIIIVFIFLIAMIHTLKRGLKSDLFCLATFSFLLSVKKNNIQLLYHLDSDSTWIYHYLHALFLCSSEAHR